MISDFSDKLGSSLWLESHRRPNLCFRQKLPSHVVALLSSHNAALGSTAYVRVIPRQGLAIFVGQNVSDLLIG